MIPSSWMVLQFTQLEIWNTLEYCFIAAAQVTLRLSNLFKFAGDDIWLAGCDAGLSRRVTFVIQQKCPWRAPTRFNTDSLDSSLGSSSPWRAKNPNKNGHCSCSRQYGTEATMVRSPPAKAVPRGIHKGFHNDWAILLHCGSPSHTSPIKFIQISWWWYLIECTEKIGWLWCWT